MKRSTIAYMLLFIASSIMAAPTAIVNQYGGVSVFVYNTPIQDYEVLGVVDFAYTPTVTTSVANIGATMIPITSVSRYTYAELRDGLVAQSIMANRSVEAIIIDGTKATMLRFKSDTVNNRIAKVDMVEGLFIFLDCVPSSDYDHVVSLSPKGMCAGTCEYIIQNIQKKRKKDLKGKVYNAAIISLSAPFKAEFVNIK